MGLDDKGGWYKILGVVAIRPRESVAAHLINIDPSMDPPTDDEKKEIAKTFLSEQATENLAEYATYFEYYEKLFEKSPVGVVVNITKPAYSSHEEVVLFFNKLIGKVLQNKADFSSLFAIDVSAEARDPAIRALLKASLMIDCDPKDKSPKGHKVVGFFRGSRSNSWGKHHSFAQFVERCFRSPAQSKKARHQSRDALEQKRKLKAWKLRKRYDITLQPTDNLAEHLAFNAKLRTLLVFRQVGFLKAHLHRSRGEELDMGFQDSLEKYIVPKAELFFSQLMVDRGTLPPQLLLEVLHSIQYVLFPNDARSTKSLSQFIKEHGFDPQAKTFENHIRTLPYEFEYKYLGSHMMTLSKFVDKRARGQWFKKHEGRLSVLIALLGVYITAFVGLYGIFNGRDDILLYR